MNIDFSTHIKKLLDTRLLIEKKGGYRSATQLILLFAVFYFATFEYFAEPHEIVRGIAEFFFVTFSLCSASAILISAGMLFSRLRKKTFTLNYGQAIAAFVAIYTCGMAILYPIKQYVWNIHKEWFWKYYWRHLPFALLIFCIFLYRAHKNSMIDTLIDKINLSLREGEHQKDTVNLRAEEAILSAVTVKGLPVAIPQSAITHISVSGHYLDLYYRENQEYERLCIRKTLTEMMNELPKGEFLRIHRSHIVNPIHITGLIKKDRRCFADMCNGRFSIPISRSNQSCVLAFLENRLFSSTSLKDSP